MMRHYNRWRYPAPPPGLPHNRAQRWPVQMVEVGMGDQNQINRWQIAYLQPRLPQALEDEKPARKIGIDQNILLADLTPRLTDLMIS